MTWEQPPSPPRRPYMGAYIHTRDQLMDRYGLRLTLDKYDALCEQLKEQDFTVPNHPCTMRVQFARRTVIIRWRVFSVPVKFVWAYEAGVIITALPMWRNRPWVPEDNHFRKQQERHARAYKRHNKHRGRA